MQSSSSFERNLVNLNLIFDFFWSDSVESYNNLGPALSWGLHIYSAEDNGLVNTLKPRRNEQHFADDIFKRIFVNENVWISITISLNLVPKGPINNILALVQIMAWRRPGDKPLSETMMVRLLTHICVTRPQWVNVHMTLLKYMTFSPCVVILETIW